jgi:hypothetical protein
MRASDYDLDARLISLYACVMLEAIEILAQKDFLMRFGEFVPTAAVAARVNALDLERLIKTITIH